MCCFSREVRHVARTRIFARSLEDGGQAQAYQMDFAAAEDLAMILPLPVPPNPGDDAVRFVDLQGYPTFFDALDAAFPVPITRSGGTQALALGAAPPQQLAVHRVGAFEASFVPTPADFERLDPRFRLPPALLESEALGDLYRDYGFAVFKLRSTGAEAPGLLNRVLGRARAKTERAHPMAFVFPRRDPDALFFPTVHVHDATVPRFAQFDHQLYAQADAEMPAGWQPSDGALGQHVDAARTGGLLDGQAHGWKRSIVGGAENRDTVVALA